MTEREDVASRRRIGALVQRRRLDLELTAAGLARKAGVNIRTLANLESGETWPRQASQAKLERALGMPLGTLEHLAPSRARPILLESRVDEVGWDEALRELKPSEADRSDATVHTPRAAVRADFKGNALEQLRAANIAVAAERLARLPAEDITRVQDLIDELGRARFPDWDDDEDDYAMAWNRRATLRRPTADEAHAVLDSLDED